MRSNNPQESTAYPLSEQVRRAFFDSVNSFPLFLIDFKNLADIHFMIILFGIIAFD